MNSQDEFQKLINELDKSPIFIMSLDSKELFHSNFWAYLMRHKDYKLFVYSLFRKEQLESSEPIEIKREFKNRDIVILYNDKEFVIENKIKSYPDQEQLRRYGEDTNMVRGIVTGIKKPPFELPEKWDFVSYSEIASILRYVITEDKYLKSIVLDYCNVLDSINTLMDLSLEETEGRLSYWTPSIGLLGNVRLMDVFRKLKADDFAIACKDIMYVEVFDNKLVIHMATKIIETIGHLYEIEQKLANGYISLIPTPETITIGDRTSSFEDQWGNLKIVINNAN